MSTDFVYEPFGDINSDLFNQFAHSTDEKIIASFCNKKLKKRAIVYTGGGVIVIMTDDEVTALIDTDENRNKAIEECKRLME